MSISYFPDKRSNSVLAKQRKEHMRKIIADYRKQKGSLHQTKYTPEARLEKRLFELLDDL